MDTKGKYLAVDGQVNRGQFLTDITRCAHEQGVSVPRVLEQFFKKEQLTKREMGRFALNTSATGNIVEGTVALIHALGVTKETVASVRPMEDYIGNDMGMETWRASWVVDNVMDWPLGTALAASRSWLEKI